MLETIASAILFASVSGRGVTETLSFSPVSFTPPGPAFGSISHALSTHSVGTNCAVIRFDYTQNGGPLGSRIADLILELHTPTGTVELDPIPGAPSAPPTGTVRFQSRRFFFDPIGADGAWTFVVSQRYQSGTTQISMTNITILTESRPAPVQFNRVRLDDGFIVDQYGPHPYGTFRFTVDTDGYYDVLANWVITHPEPWEGPSFLGGLYMFDGDYSGDLGEAIAVGNDWDNGAFENKSVTPPTYLRAGRTYSVLGVAIPPDTDASGYTADLTVTGDGTAKRVPDPAPHGVIRFNPR